MARGGKRENAGRKLGIANIATKEATEKAAETGELPRDYMLRVMRDPTVEHDRRDRMAVGVAPYYHAKLANVIHSGDEKNPIKIEKIERVITDPKNTDS